MYKINDLFKDHQLYHSEFQQDYFITMRSGGTVYGQYKQALRELYKRFRGLKGLYSERDLLQVDIDELEEKTLNEDEYNKFEQRRNKINFEKKRLDMVEMCKNIEETEREFNRFYAQSASLKDIVGELTEEKRNRLDREMWIFKIKEMAAIDLLSHGRLGNNTLELMTCVPDNIRTELLETIKDHNKLVEWFENKDTSIDPIQLDIETKKLLE